MPLLIFATALLFSLTSHASDPLIVPEAASGIAEQKSATFANAVAVTANSYATTAAKEILAEGGSAVDAAIAAQLVLGLVEPQSSGIGGGAFMLHWDAKHRQLSSWNGRETAPMSVNESHFLNDQGKPLAFFDAVIGGHAVGVPGVVAMLEAAHKQYGTLPWQRLFQPAINLAQNGFKISPRLHTLLSNTPNVAVNPEISRYFFENGQPKPIGSLLKNPAYSLSLKMIARSGAHVFYHGSIAGNIVDAVQNAANKPGKLQLSDLANYHAQRNTAVCANFRDYQICGAPPPSSGGTTVLAILGILEQLEVADQPLTALHSFIEASRLAFADRNHYLADPDFTSVPTAGLVNPLYLAKRAALIQAQERATFYEAGSPPGAQYQSAARSPELPSTSHLSIVDSNGNVVSMTTSIETAFGSRVMVGGFLLNNQLTDFSFAPTDSNGYNVANRIEPGKRPRSSMAPTLVFKNGHPVMAIGSPGGARIIDYVALCLYRILAQHTPLTDAVAAGHVVAIGDHLELETGHYKPSTLEALRKLGHTPRENPQTSGIHAIQINHNSLQGVADPRREGSIDGF
jgi:gamma-glutamyltranspeptidase / glutathione hydrolase